MSTQSKMLVGMGAMAALVAGLAAAPAVASGSQSVAGSDAVSRAAAKVTLLAGGRHGPASYVGPARTATRPDAKAATFQVTYHGFTPVAQAAFQAAVNIWASKVTSTVPITVDATFQPLGAGILGSAGPQYIWKDFTGAPQPGTWYVDAIANKRSGAQMNAAPDIVASFNSNFTNWYFGRNGVTPVGTYDFESVVMHELGHGLGFLGAGQVSSGLGTVRIQNSPTAYDRFTENGAGTKLLTFPNNSTQLGDQLLSNNVFFDSVKVRNHNGGQTARLYAPASWQSGSSYSHLDEATYPKGDANSLMTPSLSSAEAIHSPGAISLWLLKSIGW
jgi:hypothetical protein